MGAKYPNKIMALALTKRQTPQELVSAAMADHATAYQAAASLGIVHSALTVWLNRHGWRYNRVIGKWEPPQ